MRFRSANGRAFLGSLAMLLFALAPAGCDSRGAKSTAGASGGGGTEDGAGGLRGAGGDAAMGGGSATSAGGATEKSGAPKGLVVCHHPGDAGTPTQGCDFVFTPNSVYMNDGTNSDLPLVTAPGKIAPRGDADPCARQDPTSNVTYVSYTYPGNGSGALDTYLVTTNDGGAHWAQAGQGAVWSGVASTPDPFSGGTPGDGMVNSETSNLAFRKVQGGLIVYGIHSVYWSGGTTGADKHTSRLDLSETFVPSSSTPTQIHDALALAVDGARNVDAIGAWPELAACPGPSCSVPANPSGKPARNLQTLDHELDDCDWFHEPALHWSESDQALYLLVHCQSTTDNRFEVFRSESAAADVDGQGNPSRWTWSHRGPLLDQDDAANAAVAYGIEETTKPYFTQGELATGAGGKVLVLGSLCHLDGSGSEARDGQFVFEVKSLASPALTAPVGKKPDVAPYVAAVQMKLDINNGDRGRGPGSATYDRSLTATGLIYAGRTFPNTSSADTAFETDFFSFPTVTP
jgi:hypothetical protein